MNKKVFKRRRAGLFGAILIVIVAVLAQISPSQYQALWRDVEEFFGYEAELAEFESNEVALEMLEKLEVKGRAPKTGYSRDKFSEGWAKVGDCDVRNLILRRDLTEVKVDEDCRVVSGKLHDNYTGQEIDYLRGKNTSSAVQIDHIVAVSDAWQKGAQNLTPELRKAFYNDPENLLAVDGSANQQKGDSDAATWLPPNKPYRCQYVATQVRIKAKYSLWVTQAEKEAMARELNKCPK